ncbi:MAG: DHHA1 domain-containing protein, partial [bacterium]
LEKFGPTRFLGHEIMSCSSTLIGIVEKKKRAEAASKNSEVQLIFEETPFYAESGGQIGDTGRIAFHNGAVAEVLDTQKTPAEIFLHKARIVKGAIKVGDTAELEVAEPIRRSTMRNHTATHLLQAALRRVLGKHVSQAGSWVGPRGLRFDFNHMEPMTGEQKTEVERIVNENILKDTPVVKHILPLERARQMGALCPFGEKYGEIVRVVQVNDFSMEFCGGTHLRSTGEIGLFQIVSESSIASGVRRIEAVTGEEAFHHDQKNRALIAQLSQRLSVTPDQLAERLESLLQNLREHEKEVSRLRQQKSADEVEMALQSAKKIGEVTLLTHRFEDLDVAELRNVADLFRSKVKQGVTVLASVKDGKVSLLCTVTDDLKSRLPANKIIREIAAVVGGGGGGKPELAQAGGKDPSKVNDALAKAEEIVLAALK